MKNSLWTGILELLFPPKCIVCNKALKGKEKGICRSCQENMPYTEGAHQHQKGEFYSVCVSPLYYENKVRDSVLRYKFKGAVNYAPVYGKLLAECITDNLSGKYDLITWVPLSEKREKKRGYDQAMLLAMAAALELSDVALEVLKKEMDVPAQSEITHKEQRRANVLDAYVVSEPELVAGKRILLIDDIITTGATISECSRMLLSAGAKEVVAATLARTRGER